MLSTIKTIDEAYHQRYTSMNFGSPSTNGDDVWEPCAVMDSHMS